MKKPYVSKSGLLSKLLFCTVFSFLLLFNSELTAQNWDLVHTVKKGENLYRLSLRYGTTVESIVSLNNLAAPEKISVNQELLIKKNDKNIYENALETNSLYRMDTNKGVSRGAGPKGGSWAAYNEQRKLSAFHYQQNARSAAERKSNTTNRDLSSVNYTYGYGFDRDNYSSLETEIINDLSYENPEVLEIINRLDEKRALPFSRHTRKRISTIADLPKQGNERRRLYRQSGKDYTPNFRRGAGAIDNLYYKEKLRAELGGTIYYYRVKKGDSLLSIALDQKSSTQEIIALNELSSYDLRPGSILKIVRR